MRITESPVRGPERVPGFRVAVNTETSTDGTRSPKRGTGKGHGGGREAEGIGGSVVITGGMKET